MAFFVSCPIDVLLPLILVSLIWHLNAAEPIPNPSSELSIAELDFYANTDEGKDILTSEYQSIPDGQRKPWVTAKLKGNRKKNRYDNLLAYDETRVVLDPLPGDPNSDYINANYIDGHNRDKEYVATQGPLPNTVNDFWRMIWQLKITKIIMLANIIEEGEETVDKYWPEDTDTYGDLSVTKIFQYFMPTIQHVVRTFTLHKEGVNMNHTVRQFHFTGWPDLSIPDDPLSVVALMEQVRKFMPDSTAPMVLHCSAGVSRSGTVILTDSMIQKAKDDGVVDFPKRLDHMRDQRADLVGMPEDYVFAYQVADAFFNGNGTEEYLKTVDEEHNKMDTFYANSATDVPKIK